MIPRFNSEAISRDIRINQADAETIKIQKEASPITAFKAEALPEVYLKGAVKVAGLTEATEVMLEEVTAVESEQSVKIEPRIKVRRMVEPTKPKQVMVRQLKKPVAPMAPLVLKTAPATRIKISEIVDVQTPHRDTKELILPVPAHASAKPPRKEAKTAPETKKANPNSLRIDEVRERSVQPSFKPQAVVHSEARNAKKQEATSSWYFLFFAIILAAASAILILGTRAEISVEGGRHVEHWKFDMVELRERF